VTKVRKETSADSIQRAPLAEQLGEFPPLAQWHFRNETTGTRRPHARSEKAIVGHLSKPLLGARVAVGPSRRRIAYFKDA
jgi:hypothetical protein